MNILITGGSGFIGKPIIQKLLKNNDFNIKALTRQRSNTLENHENLEWIQAEFGNFQSIENKINDFKPEVIIHLAWDGIPDFSLERCKQNLIESINFFEFLFSIKTCKKILISGSCFEYIDPDGECIESQYTEPKDFFTWSKISLYNFLKIESKRNDISLGWFRIFYAYGPGQRKESLIPMIIRNMMEGNAPDIKTPNNSCDFIFVDDIAELFDRAVEQKFQSGIYNIGSGVETSALEVCREAESIILNDHKLSKAIENNGSHSSKGPSFYASLLKLEQAFHWKPRITIENGIKKTYQSFIDGE